MSSLTLIWMSESSLGLRKNHAWQLTLHLPLSRVLGPYHGKVLFVSFMVDSVSVICLDQRLSNCGLKFIKIVVPIIYVVKIYYTITW